MPEGLYKQMKLHGKKYHYASVSEMIRDAMRWWMSDNLTVNGFTEKFEKEVLKSAAEPDENFVEWDGVTPFGEFVLSHPPKNHAKNKIQRNLQSKLQKVGIKKPRADRANIRTNPMV